ncbi:MAG: hypothetical protein AAF721_34090, partial [Myxococcota bacterium]
MPTPGDIICGDVRLESLAPASLGAEVFQPVFVARRGDGGEAIWLTLVEGLFTPTPMNMSTFMAGANGMLGLRHPALVRVVLVDREEDYSVVGYEALPGAESMADIIVGGGSRTLLGRTAIELARGLAFLHRRDMLHGALTPGTVVLWEGMPLLWEHGIAALCTPSVFGPRARSLGGDVVAPEVPGGQQLTPAADVFAWGAVLASVATGMLGSEAVSAVLDGDVDMGRQAALFGLIAESLAPESGDRPRDGTHLLERLLALDLDGPAGHTASGPDPVLQDSDLGDLARRYLDEMSEVESRASASTAAAQAPASTGVPETMEDAESSGALGRVQLRKVRVATDSQKILAFVDGAEAKAAARDRARSGEDSGARNVDRVTAPPDPTPIPSPPPTPAPPTPPARPAAATPPAEDSAAHAIPLWKAASPSKPRQVASPPAEPARPPTPVADEASEELSIEVLEVPGETEADAEAELRDAFRDLTAAADAEARSRDSDSGLLPLLDVPDDPTADFGAADPMPAAGVPVPLDPTPDATPVPTRIPDPEVAPKTGGWIRKAERPDDPKEAVENRLPPVQDYGDGVHKRTFEPAAPDAELDDRTPKDPVGTAVVETTGTKETSGLAKLRRLWPRKARREEAAAKEAAAAAEASLDEESSGQQEAIARDVLADLERVPAEAPRAPGKGSRPEDGESSDDDRDSSEA